MTSFTLCLEPIPTLASGLNLCYLLFLLNCPCNSQISLKGIFSSWKVLYEKHLYTGINVFWFIFILYVLVLLSCCPFLPCYYLHTVEQELRDLGNIQIWSSAAAIGSSHRSDISWSVCSPQREPYSSCCCYQQLWHWFTKHFCFASCLNVFFFGTTPR